MNSLLQHVAAYLILFILGGCVVHFFMGEDSPWYAGHVILALMASAIAGGVVIIAAFMWAVAVVFG